MVSVDVNRREGRSLKMVRAQELSDLREGAQDGHLDFHSRGGRPGLPSLIILIVSVDVMQHWNWNFENGLATEVFVLLLLLLFLLHSSIKGD